MVTCDFLIASSSSQSILGNSHVNSIGYEYVLEQMETGNALNGKTGYTFSSFRDFPDYGNPENFPFPPATSYEGARQKLKEKEVFKYQNSQFVLLEKHENTYDIQEIAEVIGLKMMKNAQSYFVGGTIIEMAVSTETYAYKKLWNPLLQEKHTIFDQNGVNPIITQDNYIYSNTHLQLIESQSLCSKADQTQIFRYKYPFDYNTSSTNLDEPSAGIKKLQQSHVVANVIESQQILKENGVENFLSANLNVFDSVKGLLKEAYSYTSPFSESTWSNSHIIGNVFQKDSRYILDFKIDKYTQNGNLQQYTKRSGVSNCILWGYDDALPIAEIKNKTFSDIQTLLSPTVINGLSQSYSNSYIRNALNPLVGITGTNIYTHSLLKGLNTATSANEITTHYLYDINCRLSKILDSDNNIISKFSYGYGQQNWVKKSLLKIATTNETDANDPTKAVITIQYFSGFGLFLQTVAHQANSNFKDVLTLSSDYNKYGQIRRNILPTPTLNNNGGFQNNVLTLAQAFYQDLAPFDSTIYETSPLSRASSLFGPGNAWRTNNKNTQIFYESAGTDVRYYTVNNANSVILNGFYPANSLFKKRIIDEQGNTNIEISDKRGRLIQKQTQKDNSGNWLTTYYCYDGLGRPRAIIQPMAYNLNQTINATDQAHRDFVFAFEYDSRGRLIREDIPGAGERYSVYDKADRLVMQNNALQSETGKWNFWRYDAFDREVMRGETGPIGYTQSYWQYYFNQQTVINEAWDYNTHYFTNTSFPSNTAIDYSHVKQYQIYDDYDFAASEHAFKADSAYHPRYTNAKGLLTLTVKRDLNLMGQGQYRYYIDTYYYDNKNRPIQIFSTHDMGGANNNLKYNLKNFQYNFAGEVVKERIYGQFTSGNISLLTEFDRNHVGLVTNTYLTLNGGIREKISTQTYDAINRLLQKTILPDGTFTAGGFQDYINRSTSPASAMDDIAKKAICLLPGVLIGGSNIPYSATINPNAAGGTTINGLQKMDFLYHIRGGLRGINLDANLNPTPNEAQGDLYSYKLDYETAPTPQWNGNIGKQSWNNQNQLRGYDFNYDPSQRLTNANYFGAASENYNLNDLTFDDNGNIKSLKRYGKGNSGYGLQDNLTYYYQGNRLLGLTDAAGNNHGNTYHKDNGSSSDYTYYSNGSLKTDGNRSITNIDYQTYLNQTAQVNFADGTWLKNYYDGGGSLIKREKSTTETWQYIDRFVFKNGQLYSINIPDGRLIKNGANWEKEFYYKDHLGSSVVTFSAQNGNLVAKEYAPVDPFGLELFGINQANSTYDNFTYQSKEKLDDFGIFGTNDFGARVFDKFSLRFLEVDPLADKREWLTPYNMAQNNSINRIDPNGALDEPLYRKAWNYLSSLFSGSDATRNTQSVAATTSYTLIKSQEVRTEYVTRVSSLDKTDSQGRTQAKMEARAKTPAVMREVAEQVRPSSGESTRVGGTASKTNAGVNNTVGTLGKVGKVAGVAAIGVSVYNVATAENKPQAVATEGGALVGAIAGGELGAQTGATIGVWFGGAGAVPGAIIGGIIGSIGGGIIGANAGTSTYNAVTTKKEDKK